jgi:2-keto-3-deoxy-L-fuconate dehydrogenase
VSEVSPLRVIVTGGASGIGLATSGVFRASGAMVGVLDVAVNGPAECLYANANVSSDEEVRRAVDSLVADLGGLDILVNCVGIGAQGGVEANSDDEWHLVYDVNVVGMVRVIRAALNALRLSSRAAIVNVASAAATVGLRERVLYSATKGAVLSMTYALAADLLPEGIRVNAVNPGTTDTPWIGRLLERADNPETERVALERRQPHGRLIAAEEVANAIFYLASPSAGSTTGTYLAVDGGLQTMRGVSRSS